MLFAVQKESIGVRSCLSKQYPNKLKDVNEYNFLICTTDLNNNGTFLISRSYSQIKELSEVFQV